MGVIVNKENINNDDLSRRIDADLRAKMVESVGVVDGETPDYVDDSEYMEDYKKTSRFSWIWIVLIALALLSLISIFTF
ncbi:hypothetical protein J6V85_00040 [Candidatus Saccharibacteria bacterium]|nr:hypothetical protein [Candidatus Saccharibacteria bacterium]